MDETTSDNFFVQGTIAVKDSILSFSSVVASDSSVGMVVVAIGIAFIVLTGIYLLQTYNEKAAIRILHKAVEATKDRTEFAEQYSDLAILFDHVKRPTLLNPYRWYVKRAWAEYCETLVLPPEDRPNDYVRNTVRPNFFFNSHDLGFENGIWRHIPGLFVSVGLLLTFLGIIAALNELSGSFSNEAMTAFLGAAKSKFIMSLSGLAASIAFTLIYRFRTAGIEGQINKLCDAIEYRVLFHTPEQIAADQLKALDDQTKLLQGMGNDLGAKIGTAVSETLTRDLAPVLNKVSQSAGTEVSGMVGQIGDALNAKLNDSLDEMSKTLTSINRSLVDVSERLATSSFDIGEEMARGSSKMNETVGAISEAVAGLTASINEAGERAGIQSDTMMSGIGLEMSKGMASLNAAIESAQSQFEENQAAAQQARDKDMEASQQAISALLEAIENNTRDNASKMNESAKAISEAVAGLTSSINEAGERAGEQANGLIADIGADVNQKVSDTGADLAKQLADVSEDFAGKLTAFQEKMDTALLEPIRAMSKHLDASNQQLQKHAAAVSSSNTAIETSAQTLTASSKQLESASRPIADSVERAEKINSTIRQSLEGCLAMMDASKQSVSQSMQAMKTAMEDLEEIVAAADEIDGKLGGAFQTITNGLNESQDQIRLFSDEVSSKYGEGIQSLQQALDGLAEFRPSHPEG